MRFSEAFEVERVSEDDWFDPHLTVDTKLFLDPILLLVGGDDWSAAHDELIDHFVYCYRLVAKSAGPGSLSAVAARQLLTFPEPAEFCLGYTESGTAGAGSGARFATQMADGIAVAIAHGLTTPEHIEEIGILNKGIGADRISDAACNVLKHRFIAYTQTVAKRHAIQLDEHAVRNTRVFPAQGRWLTGKVRLPTNPETGQPLLLIPERLLNDLPVLNPDDWMNARLNADLRAQMNITVGMKVAKSDIVQFARQNPDRVRTWAREQRSRDDLAGYNYRADPKGVVGWDGLPREYAEQHPIEGLKPPTNQAELVELVDRVVEQFKHFIEDQRGWALLWDGPREKPEEAAQLVFLGMAQPYLRLFDVELDREVELGRGPVDFKIASGSRLRLLVEVKKAHNGKFWNGLNQQLPSYMKSDDCDYGWFVAIRYRDNAASDARMKLLPDVVANCNERTGKTIKYAAIDARPKQSASKL